MKPKYRTQEENDKIVEKVLDILSEGGSIKSAAWDLNIPLHTLHPILRRYRERNGYKSTIHMFVCFIKQKYKIN